MKEAYTRLARLLKENSFTKVLDLGAGKGYGSLLAASYRATVDAVDTMEMPMWMPPAYLLDHPYITYHKQDITTFMENYAGDAYDVVLMLNVLHFLGDNYLTQRLVPFLDKNVQTGGYAIINYYLADDPAFFTDEEKHKHTAYTVANFSTLPGYTLTETTEFWMDDFDPVHGKHQHHIGLVVMRKK